MGCDLLAHRKNTGEALVQAMETRIIMLLLVFSFSMVCQSSAQFCPSGKYLHKEGKKIACMTCKPGFFNSEWTDKACSPHTKCPPGKFTKTAGTNSAQPKCEGCVSGFYKSGTSKSSTCVPTQSMAGRCLHCLFYIGQVIPAFDHVYGVSQKMSNIYWMT